MTAGSKKAKAKVSLREMVRLTIQKFLAGAAFYGASLVLLMGGSWVSTVVTCFKDSGSKDCGLI